MSHVYHILFTSNRTSLELKLAQRTDCEITPVPF